MKGKVILGILAFCVVGIGNAQNVQIVDGAIQATFSVSPTKKVYFSQGNLQYRPSTKIWRFAEHQYEFSPDEKGWLVEFGWATSGWLSEESGTRYLVHGNTNFIEGDWKNDMTGKYANADWGVHNAISNGGNKAGMWRTLTEKEWDYLLKERPQAEMLKTAALVHGITGLILLPDGSDAYIVPSFDTRYLHDYSDEEWQHLESEGAVFLPFPNISKEPTTIYWTSSNIKYLCCPKYNSSIMNVGIGMFSGIGSGQLEERYRTRKGCVRLVQDIK